MKSAIPYHGGKYYLASKIVSLFPPHKIYVEPCFGSGAVLFKKQKEKGIIEIAADIDNLLTNFWSIIRDESYFESFVRYVQCTPFSEKVFNECISLLQSKKHQFPSIKLAWAYYVVAKQSMSGRQSTFRPLTLSRTRGNTSAETNAWWNSIEELPVIHERIKDVIVINTDIFYTIQHYDSKDTLFYIDPPYISETRVSKNVYRHEMSILEHQELLKLLSKIQGKFILSGYNSPLYNIHKLKNNWNSSTIDISNHSSSKNKKDKKQETLWFNF